jgi:hypothetical protein
MSTNTNTNTPAKFGYVTGHTSGGGTARHIIARKGDYFNGYAAAAICGTAPAGRWGTGSSAIRWTVDMDLTPGAHGDTIYPTPAEAAAARPVCRRCAAAAAKMAAAAPAAEDAPEAAAAPAEALEPAAPAAAAEAVDTRAAAAAAAAAPGARRVDLDPARRILCFRNGARAEVMSYWTGAPGRESCIDSVTVAVAGGSSTPARVEAATRALEKLGAARPSSVITAGEFQTVAGGTRGTIYIFGTWSN